MNVQKTGAAGAHLVVELPLMHAIDLITRIASLRPGERDAAVEESLGIAQTTPISSSSPGDYFIGYHPSGVASIVRMLIEVQVGPDDVLIDLGSGLGKVVFLTRILTGATARGIERDPALVAKAREAARRCGVDVTFAEGDARDADVDDATVFFLYLPFTGSVLAEVMRRVETVASRRAVVVCSLGLDLDREARWLRRRPLDSFWLAIYDSITPDAASRSTRQRAPALGRAADAIAFERPSLQLFER